MNLYSLPRQRQQLVAASLLAGALAVTGLTMAAPVADIIATRQEEIRKSEADLAKWRGIAASADLMQAASTDPAASVRAVSLALPASTGAQAAASAAFIMDLPKPRF